MDELVKKVSQKTGLPEATARQAVEVVINYLKKKLPAPIAGQLDAILTGEDVSGKTDEMIKGLGNLLK